MAIQAKQVFYVTNPSNTRWSIVLHETHARHSSEKNELDDVYVIRCEHKNGKTIK